VDEAPAPDTYNRLAFCRLRQQALSGDCHQPIENA
jgi:hypothetical protein